MYLFKCVRGWGSLLINRDQIGMLLFINHYQTLKQFEVFTGENRIYAQILSTGNG